MLQLPSSQFLELATWFFWLWVMGVAAFPLAQRLFSDHADAGYLAAKIIGWLGFSYFPWLAGSMGLLSFSGGGPAFGLLCVGIVFVIFRPDWTRFNWNQILKIELGFAALFLLGLAARLQTPDLAGLEKFMDLGFMASSMRASEMPPPDMWMAGKLVNYYYYGHASAALWALLTNVSADHGYQLHMATLFALTGVGIFCLSREISKPSGPFVSFVCSLTCAFLVLYAGNFHSVLYTVFRDWMGATNPDFYFPDSTRFIGFDPDTDDKAFTEFVAYGFRAGDMHAHLLATPAAVLAMISLLSAMRNNWQAAVSTWLYAVFYGWLLGLSYMTNAWDLAISGLLAVLVGWVLLVRHDGPVSVRFDALFSAGMICLAVAFATAAPFLDGFDAFAEGIRLADHRTPLWQLVVVYGHGIFAALFFIAFWYKSAVWSEPEHFFVGVLVVAIVLLIAIPELVYIKDAHGNDYARANTMFKLSFRSQMLLQVVAMATISFLVVGTRREFLLACVLSVPIIATFSYARETYKGLAIIRNLDGLAFLGAEREMVEYIRDIRRTESAVILEAGGDSFSSGGRVSSMTGMPTVLGWYGHETLWRLGDPEIERRRRAVEEVFTANRLGQICRTVQAYNVQYIVLGNVERELFPRIDETLFDSVGVAVFEGRGTRVIATNMGKCFDDN